MNEEFFVPEVEFVRASAFRRRGEESGTARVVIRLGRVGVVVAAVLFNPATSASEPRLVPGAIVRPHASAEMTPEVVALYREGASEDHALAEEGLVQYMELLDAEGT